MSDRIEMVDMAEVTALERAADARAEPSPPPELGRPAGAPVPKCPDPRRMGHSSPPEPPAPQGEPEPRRALTPFVSVEALDQRFADLETRLEHLAGMVRHTMLLVMTVANRQRIATEEYDQAEAMVRSADQAKP